MESVSEDTELQVRSITEDMDNGSLKLVNLYNNHIKMPLEEKKYKHIIYK